MEFVLFFVLLLTAGLLCIAIYIALTQDKRSLADISPPILHSIQHSYPLMTTLLDLKDILLHSCRIASSQGLNGVKLMHACRIAFR
jgi:hypothetical protein